MLKRKIEKVIIDYFNSERKKILIIDGARQIGKTYIINKLSKQRFPNYIEINLKDDFDGEKLFSSDLVKTTTQFYYRLSSLYGDKLGSKEDTIIFLDEIQVYPHLLSMLKPLNIDNKYTYIVSGSLLGVTLKHTFIPMGSIDEVKMYPLDFEEFLWASGTGEDIINYARNCFLNLEPIDDVVHNILITKYKEYLLCGGLPDAVNDFLINKNIMKMRKVHEMTFNYYSDDASKYDLQNKLKISRIYQMMPSYMENKVKRIQANKIRYNKKDTLNKYEDEFDYLLSSGIALGIKAISNPKFPLNESITKNLIKLYYNDVGILSNILYKNNIDAVLNNNKGVNLGSVYETSCACELVAHNHNLYYFDSKKVGEVDFIINDYENLSVLPIEIKSGNNQTEFRALPKLVNPNNGYNINKGFVLGNKNIIQKNNNIVTLPIYMIMFI